MIRRSPILSSTNPFGSDTNHAKLVCEGDPAVTSADDVWIIAERAAKASGTEVRITAGPGLTLTYNF